MKRKWPVPNQPHPTHRAFLNSPDIKTPDETSGESLPQHKLAQVSVPPSSGATDESHLKADVVNRLPAKWRTGFVSVRCHSHQSQ